MRPQLLELLIIASMLSCAPYGFMNAVTPEQVCEAVLWIDRKEKQQKQNSKEKNSKE
jgi:hypothetical protein